MQVPEKYIGAVVTVKGLKGSYIVGRITEERHNHYDWFAIPADRPERMYGFPMVWEPKRYKLVKLEGE